MHKIKHGLSLAAGLMLALTATTALAAGPLRVGFAAEPYPPFTYKSSSGQWTGFEIELANELCAQLNRECRHVPTAWSGIIPALKSNKIDMILGSMSITKKREKVVDFSRPYYKTVGAYVGPKSMQIDLPQGLKGKLLGVQSSTTHSSFARKELSNTGVELKYYDKQEQANRDLLAGRIDLTLADQIAMQQFVQRPSAQDFEIKGTVPSDASEYGSGIGVALRKSDDALRKKVNRALTTLIDNGTCAKLSQKYFSQNICSAK